MVLFFHHQNQQNPKADILMVIKSLSSQLQKKLFIWYFFWGGTTGLTPFSTLRNHTWWSPGYQMWYQGLNQNQIHARQEPFLYYGFGQNK